MLWGDAAAAVSIGSEEVIAEYLGSETYAVDFVDHYRGEDASFDYGFDAWGPDTRLRLGINNFTDERAPLCDCRFGYWSDAHRDTGRQYYLDLTMSF